MIVDRKYRFITCSPKIITFFPWFSDSREEPTNKFIKIMLQKLWAISMEEGSMEEGSIR